MARRSCLSFFGPVVGCLLPCAAVHADSVIYVDTEAVGPVHDGTSWCQAYTNLSEAINLAQPGNTIRVADGTYKPDATGLEDPSDATFALQTGVRIEGGYAGCGQPDPDARNVEFCESILDGDLDGDDIPPIDSDCFVEHDTFGCDNEACETIVCDLLPECCESEHPTRRWQINCVDLGRTYCCAQFGRQCDNAYHVVTAVDTDESAVLNGFTVTGGYASGEIGTSEVLGGGVIILDGDPTISDCVIMENSARRHGGGIGIDGGSPTFEGCMIRQNVSYAVGGGVQAAFASPIFTDCAVSHNRSFTGGGMYFDLQTYPTISGCTLSGNTAGASGGAISTYFAVPTVTDTTISNNSGGGAAIDVFFSTIFVRNCAIIGNGTFDGTSSVGGMDISFSDATIVSSLFAGNVGQTAGGIFASDSVVTLSQCNVVSNVGLTAVRGAGVYASYTTLAIWNSILWGNVGNGSMYLSTQLDLSGSSALTMAYTDIYHWNTYLGGVENFSADPLFVDPLGPDAVSGTEDDDYRFLPGSPCINVGGPAFVPLEGEVDLDGEPRLQGCRVDLGAYETDTEQLLGDFNADDYIDLRDVASFQNCFQATIQNPDWLETCLCVFDFDEDAVIDAADYPGFWTELTTP